MKQLLLLNFDESVSKFHDNFQDMLRYLTNLAKISILFREPTQFIYSIHQFNSILIENSKRSTSPFRSRAPRMIRTCPRSFIWRGWMVFYQNCVETCRTLDSAETEAASSSKSRLKNAATGCLRDNGSLIIDTAGVGFAKTHQLRKFLFAPMTNCIFLLTHA